MKKGMLFFVLVLVTGFVSAQQIVTLDAAIAAAAKTIDERLETGIKIVVLNFNSPSDRLSNYVIDELTGAVVNSGKLTVVDRQNLALIQQETNFQMSGEVSDDSAQAIGMKLGAQSIVSGSIEDMNNFYRVRFRVIEVVSAAIQAQVSVNVRKDNIVASLLGNSGFSSAESGVAVSATGYPRGLNYSTGRKVGAGFLNWIFGLGSFTMGDWVGGLIVGGPELVGMILTMSSMSEDGNSALFYLGLGLQTGGTIYGHIRPFQYDKALAIKNGTYYAYNREPWKDNPLEHIDVALLPTRKGDAIGAVRLSYSLQF
jgi:TolB-like protein